MLFQVVGTQVYLLAAMHLLPEEWQDLRPPIWQAYLQSETCIFEDNVLSPRFPFPPMKDDLHNYYPWAQALIVTNDLVKETGLVDKYGIDTQLLHQAFADKKTIDYLDNENACNAFARVSIKEQVLMLEFVLNQSHEIKTFLERIYSAWREWDTIALAELLEIQFSLFPETYHNLVTLRNHMWGPKIIDAITNGVPTLVAVGALHFIGVDGICQQVENHGHNLLKISTGT